ncbi:hypothetical protein VSR34_38800, partial [Paraburkholderia sp. JHI2823]|uniref:hypothetical protein n=1 Tax=Paraburkholderia sp. JHI2823 TaxID=3112960 RepID=UPI0031804E4B
LTDPEPRVSRIALRAKDQELAKLELVFEAIGSFGRHQEKISIDNLDRRPGVRVLDQIPHDELVEASDRGIYFSVDSYKIFNCHVQLPDGQTVRQPNSLRASLMHNWLLNDEWITRWNRRWNCNALRWAKGGIREYWH